MAELVLHLLEQGANLVRVRQVHAPEPLHLRLEVKHVGRHRPPERQVATKGSGRVVCYEQRVR